MVKSSALDEPADVALKKLLASAHPPSQDVVSRGRLIPVFRISELDQNHLGWIMSEIFVHQSEPRRVTTP